MSRIAVGIFGHAQHGKDTIADLIVLGMGARGIRAKKVSFADAIKQTAVKLLGMPPEVAWGLGVSTDERERLRQSWTKYGKNGREWLKWLGTELGREQIDLDLWVDRVVDTIRDDVSTRVFAVSDCRFVSERWGFAEKLASIGVGFHAVKVFRPGVPVDLSHPSESEFAAMQDDVFHSILANTGTPEDLAKLVGKLLKKVERELLSK